MRSNCQTKPKLFILEFIFLSSRFPTARFAVELCFQTVLNFHRNARLSMAQIYP
jgi:hypothetical protein